MKPDTAGASVPLTEASGSFPRRIRAYLAERFPLAGYSVLIFSFCSSSQFLAHALTAADRPVRYDLSTIAACVTLICIFLHLRIFDDHKDFRDDCRYWPDRVLQRGVVSLRDLKLLAALALAVELLLAWQNGTAAVVAVLTAIGFTLLMLREFFLGSWLRSRFLLYAGLHLLLMPILALVVFSFSVNRYFWEADRWFWLYSLVGFFTAFNWEISRKIRVPDDEREGLDTYSRIFGPFGAGWLVLLVRAIDTGLLILVARHLGLPTWFDTALVILFLLTGIGFLHFRLRPSATTAERMATWAGMYIILFDLLLAFALSLQRGLEFGIQPRT